MDKLLVIKIGGNVIDDENKLSSFLQLFANADVKKILVHGGGKLATRMADQLNVPQQMIDGRRITDAETLRIITMVYAGYVNKNIVALLQSYECDAIGLSGVDGNIILAHKRKNSKVDYGYAGDIDAINHYSLHSFLEQNLTPVIAPVTHDGRGQLLNTNADTIAAEIGKAMSNFYDVEVVYCFEKEGVLRDVNDEASVITEIDHNLYQQLRAKELIAAGMIPKMENAFDAIRHGVSKVTIGKAEKLSQLISKTSGTTIR